MRKYDLASIMKRAWEIVKTMVGDTVAKLSYALKQAWAEAKAPADEIVNGWNISKLEKAGANRWTKYGKDRVYLSRIFGGNVCQNTFYFVRLCRVSLVHIPQRGSQLSVWAAKL